MGKAEERQRKKESERRRRRKSQRRGLKKKRGKENLSTEVTFQTDSFTSSLLHMVKANKAGVALWPSLLRSELDQPVLLEVTATSLKAVKLCLRNHQKTEQE